MAQEMTTTQASIIGSSVPRIDGPLKTSGTAKYSSDNNLPNMVFAVPVCSTIAKGRIRRLDTTAAGSMRGVVRIYSHGNVPKLYRPVPNDENAHVDETRPPFEDETISYAGQYVAVVVAETLEQARAAARAVKVEYDAEKPSLSLDLSDGFTDNMKEESKRGDVDAAFASAAVKLDQTYVTPIETHNPIELHASVATWDGNRYVLYETTQSLMNHQAAMAQMLGVPKENVHIVMKFLGSGFGGKLWPWPHAVLAASAARDLNRPVKLVVDRHMMFTNVGHRPRTQQRMRLSASADGKLTSLSQDYASDTSILDEVGEGCGECTPYIYSTPALRVRAATVRRNLGTPTAMRGPGAVPGLFALECAMDELAIQLKMDPVQLRLKNEPALDESNNKPFSSRHMKECLTTGADKFGWSARKPEIGSMRKGDLTVGWGVAACSWVAGRLPCTATLSLRDDGTARVACATQDIGTGTYTIFAQTVAAKTGLPLNKIDVVLGNTSLPPGPLSGGSLVTGSVIPAISKAADAAVKQLLAMAGSSSDAPFANHKPDELAFTEGRVHLKSQPASSGVSFDSLLQKMNIRSAEGEGSSGSSFTDPALSKYSFHSYGAHFAEVEWDPGIARLRVSRVLSVLDVGKVINQRPARNQVEGAIVMGVGMALFEETIYDQRNGQPINKNLADYIVATNADCPEIEVTFLDYPDTLLNEMGARGVGEIGLAGVAAAIASATYHATGVRIRELPIRIEDLLAHEKYPGVRRA
jgi:xanthine dehydrogenase YagR molybdenum-binding subunit